jgi:hypothetical protein
MLAGLCSSQWVEFVQKTTIHYIGLKYNELHFPRLSWNALSNGSAVSPASIMSRIPVLALVNSRLGADIMIIRLRRVGLGCGKISVLCSQRFVPNAVACWLDMRQYLGLGAGNVLAAGPMRVELTKSEAGTSIAGLVERVGFDHATGAVASERILYGDIMLCVHANGVREASLAWHIFRQSRADLIAVGGGWAAPASAEPLEAMSWKTAAA